MNKNICDSKTNIVSSKMNGLQVSNTIKIRKTSASDILTDQVPVKKQRIKSVNENIGGEIVKRQQKRIIKRRLASTSNVYKNQETCQTQNVSMNAIRKPLSEVSNKIIFHQTANKKTTVRFSNQVLNPKSSVSNIKPTSENVIQPMLHSSQILNSWKLDNEKYKLKLKQMKDSSTTNKKHESKQRKDSTLTNEYQLNKCKQSANDAVTGGVFCSSLYNIYVNDIIEYLFSREVSNRFTDKVTYNMANFHKIFRIVANNSIRLQEYFNSFCTTVFLTAKIFQFYASTATVDPLNANVVMLASYWLASKYNDHGSALMSSEIISITSVKLAELLHFERDILLALNFSVDFPEPLTFSEYYFFHLDFRDTTIMAHCANYMIHCFLLSPWYFTYKPSKIAAAAVRLTLRYFKSMDENRLDQCWAKLSRWPAYYDASELIDVEREIMHAVNTMQDPDFKYRQAFKKFSESKYMSVSKKLLKMTDATPSL